MQVFIKFAYVDIFGKATRASGSLILRMEKSTVELKFTPSDMIPYKILHLVIKAAINPTSIFQCTPHFMEFTLRVRLNSISCLYVVDAFSLIICQVRQPTLPFL